MKKKIGFMALAVLVMAAVCYGAYATHNTKHQLTDLTLLNIEALARYESGPITFQSCYTYASSNLLPDEPAAYVRQCSSCSTVKATMYMGNSTCIGR